MADIFISYRRSDSSDVTGRIFDHLKSKFGVSRLFKDVDSIPLGSDFRTVISDAVTECKVLLAIIGDDWLIVSDQHGRRIDDPDDFVHIEVATALSRGIPVIPVLVENATMPKSEELPSPLRNLAFRNGTPVRADPDFRHDIDRLYSQLEKYVGARSKPFEMQRIVLWSLAAILIVCAVVVASVLWRGSGDIRHSSDSEMDEARKIRFYVDDLPTIEGQDVGALVHNAWSSWENVADISVEQVSTLADANVVLRMMKGLRGQSLNDIGPPKKGDVLEVRFDSEPVGGGKWTRELFQATMCRSFGHVLGLHSSDNMDAVMRKIIGDKPITTPQGEDIERVQAIWGPPKQ